jgi:hypothetical protein
MIVTWTFLAVILSIGLVFLGVKMASSVKQGDIKIFFIVMYFITLLTFFNLGSSAYFYAKTIKKRGQKGPRGLQGNVGERGDSEYCEPTCKENSIKHMVINKIKESVITNKDNVENKICRFFSDISDEESEKINNLTFNDYKNIVTNFITDNVNLNDILDALNSDGSYLTLSEVNEGEYFIEKNTVIYELKTKPASPPASHPASPPAPIEVQIKLNFNLPDSSPLDDSKIITLKYSEDPCA